jgi:hypothetical protein
VARSEFKCSLERDVFYTPFEIFDICLSVTVQALVLEMFSNILRIMSRNFLRKPLKFLRKMSGN